MKESKFGTIQTTDEYYIPLFLTVISSIIWWCRNVESIKGAEQRLHDYGRYGLVCNEGCYLTINQGCPQKQQRTVKLTSHVLKSVERERDA